MPQKSSYLTLSVSRQGAESQSRQESLDCQQDAHVSPDMCVARSWSKRCKHLCRCQLSFLSQVVGKTTGEQNKWRIISAVNSKLKLFQNVLEDVRNHQLNQNQNLSSSWG